MGNMRLDFRLAVCQVSCLDHTKPYLLIAVFYLINIGIVIILLDE
jgi:hypothetical protein